MLSHLAGISVESFRKSEHSQIEPLFADQFPSLGKAESFTELVH